MYPDGRSVDTEQPRLRVWHEKEKHHLPAYIKHSYGRVWLLLGTFYLSLPHPQHCFSIMPKRNRKPSASKAAADREPEWDEPLWDEEQGQYYQHRIDENGKPSVALVLHLSLLTGTS
jgi:hypothetical protein